MVADPHACRTPTELMTFHARHKTDLLARAPADAAELGRIAARAGGEEFGAALARYAPLFEATMARRPTRGGDVNALQHLAGHVRDREAALEIARRIEDLRAGRVDPVAVKRALRERLVAEGATWAAEQTYLGP